MFLVIAIPVSAATPTPQPTCDQCGWCSTATQPKPKPPNWTSCQQCLAKPRSYFTVFGCISTDPSGAPFVKSILSIVFGISGGIAFLVVIMGSGTILTSAGNPERLQAGKDMVTSSLIGIFLIIFSVFLLRVVGFDILKIPGFG